MCVRIVAPQCITIVKKENVHAIVRGGIKMKAKKPYSPFPKIRSALRNIYRFSPMRRGALKAVTINSGSIKAFTCPRCDKHWPIQMADVDHQPPCGPLGSWEEMMQFAVQLFEGPVQVLCKICHKRKTAEQRRTHA